ncbi:MAG: tRNA (adenosine(37)-N6)-dimethylallyltransferase MiaA [Verrucomicrobia bacterium]|nr:tRNA (adenosine(37)-N6)-dimethylallyltransferase MiaA [Verrucomicrobiota bacterium]
MIFLLGPTAAGKSRLAMEVAEQTGAEIVSVDAFQIYRGLDIGTGKPAKEEQNKVRHHLIDLVDPEENFTAADYLREAGKVLQDAGNRNVPSIWVGGTGLYHRVLTEGLSRAPGTDTEVAAELDKMTTNELVEEIRRVDLVWSEKADLKNRRRLIRALAVWRQTGKKLSDWQEKETVHGPMAEVGVWVLLPDLEVLTGVIRERVKTMWQKGWVEEVRGLMKRPGWEECPGSRAIGYAEVVDLLAGRITEGEACDKIVVATRAYAKRQLTWFRGIPKVRGIEIDPREPLPKTGVEMLVRALGERNFLG